MIETLMLKGAKTLVDTCAKVLPGEKVLIVTDYAKYRIAGVLASVMMERRIEPVISVMSPRELDGQEPPGLIVKTMSEADVIFLPVSVSISHSSAVKAALANGARVIAMSAFTEEQMYKGGIEADFVKQKPLCDRFAAYFTESDEVIVRSAAGTDFKASIKGREGNSHSGIADKPGLFTAVVNIEANVSPVENTSQGTIVVDGSIPNFGIGVVGTPVVLRIEKGFITKIDGGREARFLRDLLHRMDDPTVYNIAQIAVGLNPECRMLSGVMTNDHGAFGRVHFGIGTSTQLGGKVKAPIHFDVVLDSPTLEFDGEVVIEDGEVKATA
jgi:leucyl aminopeptidase (aminopeptidase T)